MEALITFGLDVGGEECGSSFRVCHAFLNSVILLLTEAVVHPSNANYEMCPKRTNLPDPRTISNKFHEDENIPSTKVTHMVVQFGQYLDHDIAETPR